MKIEIEILERAVNIKSDNMLVVSNGGVGDLLSIARKYGKIIEKVEVKGDCESYTFKRQVFIFANLLNYFKGSKEQVFPRYQYDKKTFS